jgi:hypothetical protein
MGMWDTFKELANPIGPQSGPLGRMLGMDEKDKRKMDPQQQYWGGSKEAYDASIARYKAGASGGAAMADGAVDDARTAAAGARNAYSALGGDWKEYNAEQSNEAAQADSGFDRSMADYRSGRAGVLNNAGRIEASAVGLPQSYQQTADRAFQLNQNRAERAAMAQGARGGAGGLRTAIASQAAAGADASAQAEIIRAQEFNDLQRQQRDAYATAAGIRAGQGAQDQGAGQIYAGRQQNSYANLAGGLGARGGLVGATYAAESDAARLGAEVGAGREANYLGAETAANAAQLGSSREYESARQSNEKRNYTNKWFPLKQFNSPA